MRDICIRERVFNIVLYIIDRYRRFFNEIEILTFFGAVASCVDRVDGLLYRRVQCITGVDLVSYVQFFQAFGQSVRVDTAPVRASDCVSAPVWLAP